VCSACVALTDSPSTALHCRAEDFFFQAMQPWSSGKMRLPKPATAGHRMFLCFFQMFARRPNEYIALLTTKYDYDVRIYACACGRSRIRHLDADGPSGFSEIGELAAPKDRAKRRADGFYTLRLS
jgi:hypothetical protein